MSALHEAARRVVSAWVSTRPAWIEQCNEAVLALDAALKAEPAQEPSESSCDECGKSKADGWALYCVECLEQFFRPAEPAQEIDVYSYAALLATAIHAKHYKDTAPQWKPLPDLLGVLTQIDNMTAGLTRQPELVQEPVAWLRVIDEAMVTHHLGVADPGDDYETAKRKMNNLLCMAQDIGTYFAKQPEPAQEPVAWATEIIDALQAQYNTEMIKENDSGDALIRLDDAIAAVEDAEKHYTTPQPQRPPLADEEIVDAVREAGLDWQAGWTLDEHEPNRFTTLARAIERKVRGE